MHRTVASKLVERFGIPASPSPMKISCFTNDVLTKNRSNNSSHPSDMLLYADTKIPSSVCASAGKSVLGIPANTISTYPVSVVGGTGPQTGNCGCDGSWFGGEFV